MQNYNRINDYITDYWTLLYDYYSKHGQTYLVTYYNLDTEQTVWDNENLMGGYYEKIGQLSGMKWKKILTFPVYFIGETDTIFDAQDIGYVNEGNTGFVIPSSYGINPYPNDMIKLYQNYLQDDDTYALYGITAVEKKSTGDRTFWKIGAKVEQSRTTKELDLQVSETLMFYNYDKKIHQIPETIGMTRLLSKNEIIRERLNNLFDQNSGLYFV